MATASGMVSSNAETESGGAMQLPLWRAVLGLAGILLILFLVAGIMLWLAFKMRLILITH